MFSAQAGMKRPLGLEGPDAWNSGEEASNSGDGSSAAERKRKRKSRWNTDNEEKTVIPGMPTVIPSNLTESQQRQYVVHLQIEEITRKLRTGDLGIPANPEQRSPSPEPIYNNEGKRLNTREYRTRKKLEEERHKLIQEALKLNPEFKPPSDYKPPVVRVSDKVMIPQEEHPDINFVGLLIGPRGNTLKTLEKDTGAKIIIRGKGSVKDGKIGRKDGQPLPGEDEPLHAYVTANNPENVKKAVEKIKEIIKQGIEVPEGQNDLRRQQLRELALLNGTLRENDGLAKLRQIAESQTIVTNTIICTVCGGTGHIAQDCKQKRPGDTFRMQQMQNPAERAKMDSEYMSLMAELGEGPPPPKSEPSNPGQSNMGRPLLANPPPNPMAINSPWQLNNRPPVGPPTSAPLLNRPPVGMQQGSPQINPLGRLPVPLMSTPMQPPPGMQAPPGLLPPPTTAQQQQQQQQQPLMGGMGNLPQMQQQQGPGMIRPWQQGPPQQSLAPQVNQQQPIMSMNNQIAATCGSMAVPPPPPSLLAPPPPPPTSSQTQVHPSPPWMQQPQAGKTSILSPPPPPPPPPATSKTCDVPFSTSSSLSLQQQNLLNIQNQALMQQQQQQQQKMMNMQGPGGMAGNSGNPNPGMMGRGNMMGGQGNQSSLLGNAPRMMSPQGNNSPNNAGNNRNQNAMMGPGTPSLLGSPGNSSGFRFGQNNPQTSMAGQMMNRGNAPNMMGSQQAMRFNSPNNAMSQQTMMMNRANGPPNFMNQGQNSQNFMNPAPNGSQGMNLGNNPQALLNRGNNQQGLINQGNVSQNMDSGSNSMNQANNNQNMNFNRNAPNAQWNNQQNNMNMGAGNNQMNAQKMSNSNMWN